MKKIIAIFITLALVLSFGSTAFAQVERDQYYARSTLSGNELEFYDYFYGQLEAGKKTADPSDYGISEERALEIGQFVYHDSPQFYNLFGHYSSQETSELDTQLDNKSAEILSYIKEGMTDIEKFEIVYAYLGENIEYDYNAEKLREDFSESKDAADAQTIIGGLINGKAVCAGIAASLQYILYQLDIPCYCVSGEGAGGHMWNIVQLDGNWYITDLTHYDEIKGRYLFHAILADERYYEWFNIEPDKNNPPMPVNFSSYIFDWTNDRPEFVELRTFETEETPAPTPTPSATPEPTPTPTQTPAPVIADTEPQEPAGGAGSPVGWIIAAGAAVGVLLAVGAMKKRNKNSFEGQK